MRSAYNNYYWCLPKYMYRCIILKYYRRRVGPVIRAMAYTAQDNDKTMGFVLTFYFFARFSGNCVGTY